MKKYVLVGTIGAFLAATQLAHAPTQTINFSKFQKQAITVHTGSFLEKYARENEINFLKRMYPDFPYSKELPKIVEHAERMHLEPELLMAIRIAENGKDSIAYGVLPNGEMLEKYQNDNGYIKDGIFYPYQDVKEKQLSWAAQTVRYYLDWFEKNPKNKDFIPYLASKYSPTENDPYGLNKNWKRNVETYYKRFKSFH